MPLSRLDLDLSKLWWVGPLTVIAAVAGVFLVRVVAFATLELSPEFPPLTWGGLTLFTTVLVSVGVGVFVVVARWSATPLQTYRRIALAALLLSLVPDLFLPGSGPGATWPAAIVLMAMHVAAWLPTVFLLSNPTIVAKRRD